MMLQQRWCTSRIAMANHKTSSSGLSNRSYLEPVCTLSLSLSLSLSLCGPRVELAFACMVRIDRDCANRYEVAMRLLQSQKRFYFAAKVYISKCSAILLP
jgi:hypothetical protein